MSNTDKTNANTGRTSAAPKDPTRIAPDVSDSTKKYIRGLHGNFCSFRGCRILCIGRKDTIGEVAHIVADTLDGPRGDPEQKILKLQERNQPHNLMLLCNNHHETIDKKPNWEEYSIEMLRDMKAEHEAWIKQLGNGGEKDFSFDDFMRPLPQFFVGREDSLALLKRSLDKHNLLIVGGLPGIGKTFVAAQFAEMISNDYQIIWQDCKVPPSLELILFKLGDFLRYKLKDVSLSQALQLASLNEKRKIEIAVASMDKHRCVLVLDQYDSIENSLLDLLLISCNRSFRNSKVLITTTNWQGKDNLFNPPFQVNLTRLDKEAGLFLIKHLLEERDLSDQSPEILLQAYERVDGHPLFLTLLVALSEKYSWDDLLGELPFIAIKAQEFIQTKVYDKLQPDAQQLLRFLSILRTPFQLSAIKHLSHSPEVYNSFDDLLKNFLLLKQAKNNSYYDIHGLISDFGRSQISKVDQKEAHKRAINYYQSLTPLHYTDGIEIIYHALEAQLENVANDAIRHFLTSCLYDARYDIALELTEQLIQDVRVSEKDVIYYAQGRAYRFKEKPRQAIDSYRAALTFARTDQNIEVFKGELAAVLLKEGFGNGRKKDFEEAVRLYEELNKSSNTEIRLSALDAIALIDSHSNRFEESFLKAKEVLSQAKNADLPTLESHSFYLIAMYYINQGKYFEAIENLKQSLSSHEKAVLKRGENLEALYHTLSSIADLYTEVGNYKDAIEATLKQIEIDKRLQLEDRLAQTLHALGKRYCIAKEYLLAKEALTESLKFVSENDAERGLRRANLEWLAVALWYVGDFELSIETFLEYIYDCNQNGKNYAIHMIILEDSLRPEAEFRRIEKMGGHPLILPRRYGMSHLSHWFNNVNMRRPEFNSIIAWMSSSASNMLQKKVNRNEPCPCGSGKKYKYCCGKPVIM